MVFFGLGRTGQGEGICPFLCQYFCPLWCFPWEVRPFLPPEKNPPSALCTSALAQILSTNIMIRMAGCWVVLIPHPDGSMLLSEPETTGSCRTSPLGARRTWGAMRHRLTDPSFVSALFPPRKCTDDFLQHKYDFSVGRGGTCWEPTALLKCQCRGNHSLERFTVRPTYSEGSLTPKEQQLSKEWTW